MSRCDADVGNREEARDVATCAACGREGVENYVCDPCAEVNDKRRDDDVAGSERADMGGGGGWRRLGDGRTMTRDLMDVLAELAGEGRVPVDDRSHRDRPLWPHVGGVEFLLGVSVYAYEGGRVDIVSWREHGSIGLVGWGGLRHLTDEDGRSSTERGVGDR